MNHPHTLILACQAGDQGAFRPLVEDYQQKIFSYIYSMVRDYQEAENLCQDTFITAYEKIGTLKDPAAFSSWLYRIAHGKAMGYFRKKKLSNLFTLGSVESLSKYAGYVDTPFDSDDHLFERNDVREAFDKLSPADQSLVLLRIKEGLHHKEIATVLGLSQSACQKRYERALKKKRKHLGFEREMEVPSENI